MGKFPGVARSMLASFIFWGLSPFLSQSCELVPDGPSSCLDLQATPLITSSISEFGPFIEGASTNPFGHLFAVNYGNASTMYTLGQVYPGNQRLFYADPNTSSLLNGIRFLNRNVAFAVDAVNHRVLRLALSVDSATNFTTVEGSSALCQNSDMLQPNDLTLSKIGTVFTSGMRWISDTNNTHGDIWSCLSSGLMQKLEVLGRTNGIDLNPEETKLYVSESYNQGGVPYVQKIWVYDVNPSYGTIENKALFADFAMVDGTTQVDIDGMKTDMAGNLWVTRHGGREVVVFNEQGNLIGKVGLNFPNPTNLEFGGPSGTTLFIVGKCETGEKGCVDAIEVVTPGRSWTNLQG